MKNTRTAAQLPDTQKRAVKNSTAQNTPPMVTVYDGGITEEIVHGRLDTKLNFLFFDTHAGVIDLQPYWDTGKNCAKVTPFMNAGHYKTERYE